MLSKEWYINFYGEERGKLLYKLAKLDEENREYSHVQYYKNENGEIFIECAINHYLDMYSLEKFKKHYPNRIIKFVDDEVVAISRFKTVEQLSLF